MQKWTNQYAYQTIVRRIQTMQCRSRYLTIVCDAYWFVHFCTAYAQGSVVRRSTWQVLLLPISGEHGGAPGVRAWPARRLTLPTAHYSPFLSPHFLYLSHRRRHIAHVRREATRIPILYKSCGQARAPLCSTLMGRSSTCHVDLRTCEPCGYAVQKWTNQYA